MKIQKTLLQLAHVACFAMIINQSSAVEMTPETDAQFEERMRWFNDAQFGLFIHYGVYSTLGGEWQGKPVQKYAEWIQRWGEIKTDEYIPLAANFRPDKLDADLWVKTAKEAGMKYMVITAKHHEGFCLWDSELTEYDLGDTNDFDRDILGELKAACEKYGLKFGTYYSILDWHHPTQRIEQAGFQSPMSDKAAYVAYMKGQLKELIDRYDPAIMWFDADWVRWWTEDDGIDLYNYLREQSPKMLINNRFSKRGATAKDFGTPENSTPGAALDHYWEACWTVNHSWGYKKSDHGWKSNEVLVQKQIDINTKGGNLLLNVGPKADGSWPDEAFGQLAAMGTWNHAHAEAVYETEYVDLPVQGWGKLSQLKGSDSEKGQLFAYIFQWPESGKLLIKRVLADKVKAATYAGQALPIQVTEKGLEVDLSSAQAAEHATVLRIDYIGLDSIPAQEVDLGLQGNELILQAADATRNNTKVNLEGEDFLSFTRRPENIANWTLNVPAPATYQVKILYSGSQPKGKAQAIFQIGEQELKVGMAPTAAMDTYTLLNAGDLNLQQVGTVDLKLDFGNIRSSDLYHVKTLLLVPISE